MRLNGDIRQGYNVWIDLVDPMQPELSSEQSFHLDSKTFEGYSNRSKKLYLVHIAVMNAQLFISSK